MTKKARARSARAMATAMRVVGKEKRKGGKAMAMATGVAGERTATVRRRAMAMATREAGEEEGNGKDNKSDGNGEEDSNGE